MSPVKVILLSIFSVFFTTFIFAQGPFAGASSANVTTVAASPLVYCIPPATFCGANNYISIDSVGFSNLHNVSGCGVNGYTDYSTTVAAANVQAGTLVPIAIKFNALNFSATSVIVGTDFNHNGSFESTELQKLGSGMGVFRALVRIPFTAMTGTTVMRIRIGSQSAMCTNGSSYGETEDYLINVSAAASPGPNFSFYVNSIASGAANGMSWANAFTNLSTALSLSVAYDTIRVAKGTYVPGNTTSSYYGLKDSVIILGGYPNTGNPGEALRNWSLNQTILSGKFGPNNGDHTETVVVSANRSVLDGFILEQIAGNSQYGGALLVFNSVSPKFNHCVFRDNSSYYAGSCMRCSNSSPVFSDCIFVNNTDYESVIINKLNSNLSFNNCVFYKNNSSIKSIIENDQSTTSFTNCDFVTNFTGVETINAGNNSVFNINNSIFYNNQNTFDNESAGSEYSIDSSEIALINSTITIANTITQVYNYGDISLLSKDPKFRDTSSITGADNLYFSADDGLQLINPCSPAMNRGSNAAAAAIAKDILGNQRIFATTVDLGAYEVQQSASAYPHTLYVNKLATGNGSGTSWANAFTDLQQAIQYCSDTIRVAAGTYYPSVADEKKSFWLQNRRVILGGYPNTGSPTDAQRNPTTNPTILSGAITGNTERSDIIVRGRTVDSTAVTDGFIIKNAEAFTIYDRGAIYINNKANPLFRNCIISDNTNNDGSALVTSDSARPTFVDCIIENNNANVFSAGGAVANHLHSSPFFLRCIFRNNLTEMSQSEYAVGGAVYNIDSAPVFDSCTFYKNGSSGYGGAFCNYNSDPVIRNCIFNGNFASADGLINGYGNDFYNDHSSPQLFNTKIYDSTVAYSGGCMVNKNGSNPFFKKCEFHNCRAQYDASVCDNDQSSPVFEDCLFTRVSIFGLEPVIRNENNSNPVFINCVAADNVASVGTISFMLSINSNPVVKSCTFANNISVNSPSVPVMVNSGTTQLTLSNCIFWNRYNYTVLNGPLVPEVSEQGGSVTVMNNCLTAVLGTTGINGNIVGVNPLFVNISNPAGADGIFYTNDDGLRLVSCSPALNAGLNSSITGYNTDFLNNPRIYNSTVDIGAYEYQGLPAQTTNTFTGAVNNLWENPANWSLGVVPNACTNVIINANTVLISANTTIWSMTVNAGGQVTVGSGYNLTILH